MNLGGLTKSQPIIVATPPGSNRIDLFVVGIDNHVYHMLFSGGTPSLVWDSVPNGVASSVPAVVSDGNGNTGGISLVVGGFSGIAGSLPVDYNRYDFSNAAWAGWQFLKGYTQTAPSLIVNSTLGVYAAVTGLDSNVYTIAKPRSGVFGPWTNLGGIAEGQPAIAAAGTNIVILVRGADSGIKSNIFNGTAWQGLE
jgi:hypothetical protein